MNHEEAKKYIYSLI